jgi:hypothetical protein
MFKRKSSEKLNSHDNSHGYGHGNSRAVQEFHNQNSYSSEQMRRSRSVEPPKKGNKRFGRKKSSRKSSSRNSSSGDSSRFQWQNIGKEEFMMKEAEVNYAI